ncbi:MAG: hypothetical protein ABJF23_05895 [Bryobacteraceae bacterium]
MKPSKPVIVRWSDPDPSHVPLLAAASIDTVLLGAPHGAFETAARAANITAMAESERPPSVAGGLWPGTRRAPGNDNPDDEVASASREPWIDANGHLVAYERALHPAKDVLLGYRPNDRIIPFDTLELALAEAWVYGGNFILTLQPRFRSELLAGTPAARAAWDTLGQTVRFLKEQEQILGQPVLPIITAVVEPGAATAEIANLLHRRGASPALVSAQKIPPKPGGEIKALVAAGLKQVPEAVFAHAAAGGTVIIDSPPPAAAKRIKQEQDRDFLSLGSGRIVAYHKRITDPSEFALDVIDVINHRQRAVRLWNARSSIPLATTAPGRGELLLHILQYGSGEPTELQARVQGHFSRAVLLSPGSAPLPLHTARRGSTTEVFLTPKRRLAIVRFSGALG